MNILRFMTPKQDVAFIYEDFTLRQTLEAAINENFVPVVDDRNVFIGIVRRNAILEYFREKVHESRALQQREVVGAAW